MKKTVYLFSGQGSQYSGMGKEICEMNPASLQIYECASDILGFDLAKICFDGEEAELAKTSVAQPAIMATSLAVLELMENEGIPFEAVAGHSLGEYAAMVASGMLSLEDGFRVIKERAAAMQECAEHQDGSMYAILGLDSNTIAEICASIDGYVVPVNYNSPAQTVIAGETPAVEAAVAAFEGKARRAAKLNVNAAFHSKLMQPAADRFKQAISGISFHTPAIDFYANLTGAKLEDFSDMPSYLASHLVSPVQFVKELNALQQAGFENYVELGPNKVLTGLVKKTLKDVTAVNVENKKTVEAALAKLQ